MAHDASTGFHDIKPLPEFNPFPLFPVLGALIAIALLVLLARYFKKRKQKQFEPPSKVLAPEAIALGEIARLTELSTNGEIELRFLAVTLSLVIRAYLEAVFKIPATDQTTREVVAHFPTTLKRYLPRLPEGDRLRYVSRLEQLLSELSYFAFGSNTEQLYSARDERVLTQLEHAKNFVTELAHHLAKEAEWKQGVLTPEHEEKLKGRQNAI